MQVGSAMLGFGLGLVALVSGAVGLKFGLVLLIVLPMLGGLAPSWWLRHRIKVRRGRCTNDLPDLLDLMLFLSQQDSGWSRPCRCRARDSNRRCVMNCV